ncbi:MAG: PQQ-binding-like beta-propeller repeat protein [Phycisphaerales bacterium]|nr:PQQ-binding-like beta-propeller repeat protein [Phycisphaerales bacterium]
MAVWPLGRTRFLTARTLIVLAGVALLGQPPVHAQPQVNPVYVDDSPAAADTLARVKDHVSSGNLDEAVRVLQVLLEEHGDRMFGPTDDPEVFIAVRARVHQVLQDNPTLVARYRTLQGQRAAAELAAGNVSAVERMFLLTEAGFDAALSLAQRRLENGQFEAARLVLEQLERHPDRTGARADRGASLLTQAAAYIDRPDVWTRTERWTREAGRTPGADLRKALSWPETATSRGQSPLDKLPDLSTDGLISKPLWTIAIGPGNPSAVDLPANTGMGVRGAGNIPAGATLLEMLPSVCGDLLIVNDGAVVSAWDRFTLAPRWTLQPNGATSQPRVDDEERIFGIPRRAVWGSQTIADALTVIVRGRYGAVATGRDGGAGRDGDDRVHGFDARTGRIRWTRLLSEIDPNLAESAIRGPIDIDQGVVVFAARKHLPDRRLMSLTLVGLDADSGATLWTRLIGSAGWLPFAAQSFGPEGSTIDRGIIYRTDRLGIAGAVEVVSGRTLWARRMPTDSNTMQQSDPQAWEISRPVVDDTQPDKVSLIVIAPDQRRIVRLDAATGGEVAECTSNRFGQPPPAYLLRVGRMLAAVPSSAAGAPGNNRVYFAPIGSFDSGQITSTPAFDPPGVWGRVSIIGDKLLAPIAGGLAVIDPLHASGQPVVQALDAPGNILALGRQLLVVDDSKVHSYLQWETADAILSERMKADPRDPTPAVTFAELAYRAGRPQRIGASVDAAIAAMTLDPESERSRASRTRLFESLNEMVNSGLEPADQPGKPAVPEANAAAPQHSPPRITDRALLAMLIDRMEATAATPDDRVAVAIAGGRLAELDVAASPANAPADAATRAASLYQRVLDDPRLAVANWRGGGVSVRGELEAARRLDRLIAAFGPTVYAAQDEECRRRLIEAGTSPSPELLEQLVARFPLATSTPEAYLKLHTALRAGDSPRRATAALETGLRAAQRIKAASPAAVGELGGRLLSELRARKQDLAASTVLRAIRDRFPGLVLTVDGQPLDLAAVEAEIAGRLSAEVRWPALGEPTSAQVQLIQGSALLEPLLRDSVPNVSSCLAMETERDVAVWTRSADNGQLSRIWSRPIDGPGAALIRSTPDAAYILSRGNRAAAVEKVALTNDARGWKTDPISHLFPPDDSTRGLNPAAGVMADLFETPDDGLVPADDLVVVMDERTLVLVQRGGRACAIDTDTGEVLWSAATPVARVYDAQVAGGTLVIAGDAGRPDGAGAINDVTPTIQVIDARSGRMGQRLGDLDSRVRWVRLIDQGAGGTLITGLENKVVSIDLTTNQRNWTIESAEIMPAAAAWVFGDRLLLMSTDRSLWLAAVGTGRLNLKPLETPRSHVQDTRELDAFLTTASADGPFAISTQQGVMIFGPSGELDGIDGLGGAAAMIPPLPAQNRVASIETTSSGRGEDGSMQFSLHMFENGGGMMVYNHAILLGARPSAMALMDGKIALTAGAATVILDAPARAK